MVGRFANFWLGTAVGGSFVTPVVNCNVSGVLANCEIRFRSSNISRDRISLPVFSSCSSQRARISSFPSSSLGFYGCVFVSNPA